ncbi:winged helix-turn-helix transcriptional regulator [Nocardia sp. NPDC057227]|uniref:winged helix-turn-helix transcriptional regulator n=1 Tax=Nocardia sp. NPDC057227 TaxID=3346056 RepID=UPI003643EF1A
MPTEQEQAAAVARRVFGVLSTKWALAALEALGAGERRFADLHRALDGISYTVLTRTLRALESEGVVARFDHGTAAPRVDYALTPAGRDLLATVHGLCAWSSAHLDDLLAP